MPHHPRPRRIRDHASPAFDRGRDVALEHGSMDLDDPVILSRRDRRDYVDGYATGLELVDQVDDDPRGFSEETIDRALEDGGLW